MLDELQEMNQISSTDGVIFDIGNTDGWGCWVRYLGNGWETLKLTKINYSKLKF